MLGEKIKNSLLADGTAWVEKINISRNMWRDCLGREKILFFTPEK
jgi:hypothetical protein